MGEYCRTQCVGLKLKVPPLYFRPVPFIEAWGGVGTRAARRGVSEGPSQCFLSALSALDGRSG